MTPLCHEHAFILLAATATRRYLWCPARDCGAWRVECPGGVVVSGRLDPGPAEGGAIAGMLEMMEGAGLKVEMPEGASC